MPALDIADPELVPEVHHLALHTTFRGIEHPLSTSDMPMHQYLGIKYASVPARFRSSKTFVSYPALTDCTKYGCAILTSFLPLSGLI